MIHIENGKYIYENQIGMDHINLDIEKGESVSIMGPNGAGKSTLLKIIVGLFALSEGKYTFDGEEINKAYIKDLKRVSNLYRKIGFVFQNIDVQLFNFSVYEELAFGVRQLGLSEDLVERRVEDCLKLLQIEHLKNRVPYQLSGGEKKLVAIGSVLTMNPEVIILDEPFNGLSPRYVELIKDVLYSLKKAGKTIIITSHHFNQVSDLVDSLYLFGEEHTIKKKIERHEWDNLPTFMEFLDNV
ncbi:MAG: energy-coupling factor ABC transporter ATP-binding protein [Lachnoanaerobaculum gingivalis]